MIFFIENWLRRKKCFVFCRKKKVFFSSYFFFYKLKQFTSSVKIAKKTNGKTLLVCGNCNSLEIPQQNLGRKKNCFLLNKRTRTKYLRRLPIVKGIYFIWIVIHVSIAFCSALFLGGFCLICILIIYACEEWSKENKSSEIRLSRNFFPFRN